MVIRGSAPRRFAAGLAALGLALAGAAIARIPALGAQSATIGVTDQPVVEIVARAPRTQIIVRSWDRPAIGLDSSDDRTTLDHEMNRFGPGGRPLGVQIPPAAYDAASGEPTVVPPEDFPYAAFRPGMHDVVTIAAPGGAHLVVTVPSTTGVLDVMSAGGSTEVEDYRGDNLLVVQRQGSIALTADRTAAFVQLNRGRLVARDDQFERLRARSNTAALIFAGCYSGEIEATTISGPIVYDDGEFDAGPARFDSLKGDIALGTSAPAQIAGRAQSGRVYTAFGRGASVDQRSPGVAIATVGAGGSLVNAISALGDVYLYDGSLRGRRDLPAPWRKPQRQLAGPPRQRG